jgi:hypothetical protein
MTIAHYTSKISVAISLLTLAMVVGVIGLVNSPVRAESSVCHAVMVLDRSGSVGAANETTLKNQIFRLFEPTGLYTDNVQLAFWSFSANTPTPNYNAPFNGFVSSHGHNTAFDANLNSIVSNGGTDYEQGFGYNNGVKNAFISNIMDQADIIVFMTDGLPNTPGSATNPNQGPDGNAYARSVARQAVLKIQQTRPRIIIPGIVGNASPASLNFVVNGSDTNSTNLFHISTTYTDLATKLKQVIGTQCDALTPPPSKPYSLSPSVTPSNSIVTGVDGASFSYHVNNNGNTQSDTTNWSVKRVVVNRGQSIDPLLYGNDTYRDGYSCVQLKALINNNGACDDNIESGQRAFGPGNTDWNASVPLVVQDSWTAGSHICYILTLDKPTNEDSPTNRFSKAACVVVGKRPLVQVWGGDLRVGRHFVTDTNIVPNQDPARVATSLTTKTDGKTYGSWAEYGVFSAGPVVGFASMAGLEGGYISSMPNTQEFWSKLTFANTDDQYGQFTDDDNGSGTIPDVKTALLAGHSIVQSLNTADAFDVNNPNITSGVYQKDTGNLTVNGSTLTQGKTVIINVPNGTVNIAGDLNYNDGPYTDISQIPRLVIIAKNIVIQSAVGHVAAWLISDDPSGGTIATCEATGALTIQVCSKQLQIDGPVMARHLSLRRTAGAGPGADASTAAEIINLPADAYLWSQSEGRSDTRVQATSTVELPPYF